MKTSEQIDKIASAFAKAQADISTVRKDKKANAGKYGYTYASLAAVVEAVSPALAKHEISFVQGISQEAGACTITTRIIHSSGQWFENECMMPIQGGGAQAVGSAITYGRRYGLSALIGIVSDDDDDGAEANKHAPRKQSAATPPAQKPSLAKAVEAKAPVVQLGPRAQVFVDALKSCENMKVLDNLVKTIPKESMTEEEITHARIEYAKIKAKMAEKIMAGEM